MSDLEISHLLDAMNEQISQLTKEREDIQLKYDALDEDYAMTHKVIVGLKVERDQLAAKCAEMRDILTDIEMCNEEYERVCPGCHEPIMDADENILETEHSPTCKFVHALSNQCGTGWLSPEKAGRLREALRSMVTQLEQEEIRTNFPFTSKLISEIGRKALEDCK